MLVCSVPYDQGMVWCSKERALALKRLTVRGEYRQAIPLIIRTVRSAVQSVTAFLAVLQGCSWGYRDMWACASLIKVAQDAL